MTETEKLIDKLEAAKALANWFSSQSLHPGEAATVCCLYLAVSARVSNSEPFVQAAFRQQLEAAFKTVKLIDPTKGNNS